MAFTYAFATPITHKIHIPITIITRNLDDVPSPENDSLHVYSCFVNVDW
jgi:hypothetical protein